MKEDRERKKLMVHERKKKNKNTKKTDLAETKKENAKRLNIILEEISAKPIGH